MLNKPLSALYYTVVVVYGSFTLGYNCHVYSSCNNCWLKQNTNNNSCSFAWYGRSFYIRFISNDRYNAIVMMDKRHCGLCINYYNEYTVKTRVFGKLFKIYTWVLKGVIVPFRSNVSIATKALHPGGIELKPLHKHPLYTLTFTVYTMATI